MRKTMLIVVAGLISIAAAPPVKPDSPSTALKITEDDRDVILGFEAARALALAPIEARQAAYLHRLADRLKIDPDVLSRSKIDLKTLTVVLAAEPKVEPSHAQPPAQ